MVDVQKLDGFCSESFGNSTGDRVRNETKYWIFAYCALCHFVNFWGGWKKLSNKGYLGRLISVSLCRWFGNQIVWCVQFLSVCVCMYFSKRPNRRFAYTRWKLRRVCVKLCPDFHAPFGENGLVPFVYYNVTIVSHFVMLSSKPFFSFIIIIKNGGWRKIQPN